MSKFVDILSAVFEKPQNWIRTKEKNEQSVYDLINELLGASGEVKALLLLEKYSIITPVFLLKRNYHFLIIFVLN
jgi:hypothetical protein